MKKLSYFYSKKMKNKFKHTFFRDGSTIFTLKKNGIILHQRILF